MAEMYGIKIVGETPGYEHAVKNVLDQIAGNYLGPVIFGGIITSKKRMTIVPYDKGKAANYGHCNAGVSADNPHDAAPDGVRGGVKGAGWFIGRDDNPNTSEDERYDQHNWKAGPGTGKGSSVRVYFTPGTAGGCGGGAFGSQPDEVLFHELVHALRAMQGHSNSIPTEDGLRGYTNEEEFLAIVATNVYISAKPSTQLRADHTGFRRLQPPLNTSAGFLANRDNRRLLEIYRTVWRPTFQELASAGHSGRPVFNPFRELEDEFARIKAGKK